MIEYYLTKMSDKTGFVYIHRKVLDHWIFDTRHIYSKFEAWIDILLNVNQKKSKPIYINGEYFIAERGQSLFSLETWATRWNWDKSKVRRFLDKLVEDKMIVINNEKKTTRITVCNYDTYNRKRHSSDTAATPNNNILSNDSIKKKKGEFVEMLKPYNGLYPSDMLNDFYRYWTELTTDKKKLRWETQKTWEINLRLITWKKKGESMKPFKNNSKSTTNNNNVSN